MGSRCSYNPPGYDEAYALRLYEIALQNTCLLPDVGIDDSLMKYSGLNSSTELQTYSNELANRAPEYVYKLGITLRGLSLIPNAVGLGALVISMIMEIAIKSSQQTSPDTFSLLRRVFGEEKASAVRDTISGYLERHELFIDNGQRLQEELRRHEEQLSDRLNALRNSLSLDNQMSTRGFKIWVNGAFFHIQMLIHEARLKIQAGEPASDLVRIIDAAIGLHLRNLKSLLEKYKTYKINTMELESDVKTNCGGYKMCGPPRSSCAIKNPDVKGCEILREQQSLVTCNGCNVAKFFMNNVFSKYEPILSLMNHFSDMRNNINSLINQHDAFTLPSST